MSLKINSKTPEIVFVSIIIGVFAKRYAELKSNSIILSTSAIIDDLNDPKFNKELLNSYYFTDWKEPEEFVTKYEKRFHIEPIHEASKSYYSLIALKEALIKKDSSESLMDSLRKIKIIKSDGDPIDFLQQPFANFTKGSLFQVMNKIPVEIK